MFYGVGYPATVSSGFSKAIPNFGKAVAPGFYGKPFGKAFGKPFVGGFGFPATKAGGYSTAIPATTVATSPVPGVV